MPKIFTLIIAAVIIYTVIDAKRALTPPVSSTPAQSSFTKQVEKDTAEMEGGIIEKTLSKVIMNVIQTPEGKDLIAKIITPAHQPVKGEYTLKINDMAVVQELFHIETKEKGAGLQASCGHTVKIDYKIMNSKNVIVDNGQKTFRLGDPEVIPGLSSVIVGMQKMETRNAMLHKSYAYNSPLFHGNKPEESTEYYYATITLTDIAPENFAGDNVKIFDDEIAFAIPYLCGSPAVFNAKIMKIDGSVIYDSKVHGAKVHMNLGDDRYPMIFSHALFNKVPIGSRTVICPAENLKSFDLDGVNKILPKMSSKLNAQDFVIVEFSDFKNEKKKDE